MQLSTLTTVGPSQLCKETDPFQWLVAAIAGEAFRVPGLLQCLHPQLISSNQLATAVAGRPMGLVEAIGTVEVPAFKIEASTLREVVAALGTAEVFRMPVEVDGTDTTPDDRFLAGKADLSEGLLVAFLTVDISLLKHESSVL